MRNVPLQCYYTLINDVQNSRKIHRLRFYRRRVAFVDIPRHIPSLTIIKVIVTRSHGRVLSIFIRIIFNVLICKEEKK